MQQTASGAGGRVRGRAGAAQAARRLLLAALCLLGGLLAPAHAAPPSGTPPISITVQPISGLEAPATIEVSGESTPEAGIEWMALYQNAVQIERVNDYLVSKTISGLAAGTYNFSVTAKDFGGRTNTVNKQVVIQAVNQAPVVSLSLPGGTEYLAPANIALTSNPTDSDGSISKVEYFANGAWVAASMTAPFSAQWNGAAAGTYTVVAHAYDNKNKHGESAPITVVVGTAASEFVSQSVPAAMTPGATYPVSVQIRNTGTAVWRSGKGFKLGSFNPFDNVTWGLSRVGLSGDVAPGQIAVFNFNVTAPPAVGAYNFQWQMLQDGVRWFGAASANQVVQVQVPPTHASEFVSQSVPAVMQPGAAYSVSVQMRNTGTRTWRIADQFRLGSQNPADNGRWNIGRVDVPADIATGQIATFNFTVRAPASPGAYDFQWQMLQEGMTWFGPASPNLSIQVQAPPPTPMLGVRTRYDQLGRVISAQQDSELGVLTTTTEYHNGLQTLVRDPRGNVTLSAFQAFGAPSYDTPVIIDSPEDSKTEIARDVFGKPTWLRRRNGDQSLSLYRYFVYDAHQRLCKSIEPETGATVTAYDDAGNPAWSAAGLALPSLSDCNLADAQASGRRVDRGYDNRNRLHTLAFPDGRGNQTWLYTPDGLPREVTTSNDGPGLGNVVNTYAYNKRRLLSGESASQPGWYTWTSSNGYDGNGNRNRYSTPDGLQVSYANNALGQPLSVSSGQGTHASGISYYPNGAIKQFTYGNGIVHTMTQNARQLPARSVDAGVIDFETGYDHNGNVGQILDRARGDQYSRWMTYDHLNRLSTTKSCSFGGDCWHRFGYDALDNLKSWSLGGVKDHRYFYDANNRLTNIRDPAGATVIGLGYDAQGNLGNKNGQAYEFDFGNRLRKAVGKEVYRYDAQGRRVSQTGRADTTFVQSFYNQAGQVLLREEHHDAEAANDSHRELNIGHVYLGSSLLATVEFNRATNTTQIKYQHTDALSSPVAVTNTAGQVIERTEWEPYGAAINKPAYDGVGYTGHVMDGATGLTYMQQRYYDEGVGRFLSVDPVTADNATGANFNRYWYANNNPFRFTDPDGRWVEDAVLGVPSIIVGAISFSDNISAGNLPAAALDAVGIVADGLAIATPGLPGGAGLAINAARVVDNAAQTAQIINEVSDSSGTLYHYTDAAGADGIKASNMIAPDARGRVYLTPDKVSAKDASNALFMGQGGTKGTHRVDVNIRVGAELKPGTQPNELIHQGGIRDGRQADLQVKENDF